jgi:hypothetical protein
MEKLRLAARMLPPDESIQRAAKFVEQAMQASRKQQPPVSSSH